MKNVCLVGYGNIGPNHANAFKIVENAKFYAVCDNNPDKIKKCQEDFDVIGYTDFDEMLKDENIHSVHICTPHYLHFEMIVKAIKAGKTIVSEKPITMTKEEFNKLRSIEGSDRICLVFQNRLNNCAEKLKEIADSGELGNVVAAKSILTWSRGADYYNSADWRGKFDTEGGGVLINQAVHSLDLIRYIVGDFKNVCANMMNYSLQDVIEVEDTFVARIGYVNGAKAFFVATNSYPVNSPMDIEIVFEKGVARYTADCLTVNGDVVARDEIATEGKKYWGNSHARLIKNFYDKGEFFGINDAENTMYTMFAMYESARNGGKEILI